MSLRCQISLWPEQLRNLHGGETLRRTGTEFSRDIAYVTARNPKATSFNRQALAFCSMVLYVDAFNVLVLSVAIALLPRIAMAQDACGAPSPWRRSLARRDP